jgi:nucleoside-diphosphate-sugar epimerase
MARAMESMDLVFHLAAEHRDDVRPLSLYYNVNVEGTRNVLSAAEAVGVESIVFTSTVALYGLQGGEPEEDATPAPFNDYGRSKLQAEELLAEWVKGGDRRRALIVRPTVVFGEGNKGNVNTLIRQIDQGRFVFVGSGQNRKSMCYVGNFVPFLTWLSEQDADPGFRIFNYVDKPDLTSAELVRLIRSELGLSPDGGVRLPKVIGMLGGLAFDAVSTLTGRRYPVSSIRIRKFCADTTIGASAVKETSFEPPFAIRDGLHRTIRFMECQGLLRSRPASGHRSTASES